MRKTILFLPLPLLLLAGCGKNQRPMTGGADNDSPIIISDTSTGPIMTETWNRGTTIRHQAAPGNKDHFQKNTDNNFVVHDKENGNGKDLRAVCFTSPFLSKPIPILDNATGWEISLETTARPFSVNWVSAKTGVKEKGDITAEGIPFAPYPTDATKIKSAVTVTKITLSIDGNKQTDPQMPSPPANGVTWLTVHYCPAGQNCILDGKDPCK